MAPVYWAFVTSKVDKKQCPVWSAAALWGYGVSPFDRQRVRPGVTNRESFRVSLSQADRLPFSYLKIPVNSIFDVFFSSV